MDNVIEMKPKENKMDLTKLPALPETAAKMLRELVPNFDGLQLGMSGYQIEEGVLRLDEFPTPDSKYWQCIREIHARYGSLINDQYNLNKMELEIENANIQIDSLNEHNMVLSKIQVRTKLNSIAQIENDIALRQFNIMELKKRIQDTLRQIQKFAELMEKWNAQRKHETKEESEKEYWAAVEHIRKEKENREAIRQLELSTEVQRRLMDRIVTLQPVNGGK